MQTLSWTSIAFYCAFGVFVFYQQLHVKNFRGASQGFALALNLSALAGMLTGIAYLTQVVSELDSGFSFVGPFASYEARKNA